MTVLVDSSVWIDHLRRRIPSLAEMLENGTVACHPFVIGELALGDLRQWAEIRTLLTDLPRATPASHEEVMQLVDRHDLYASGIDWVDAHLLASARLTGCALWSRDRRLLGAAGKVGVAFG